MKSNRLSRYSSSQDKPVLQCKDSRGLFLFHCVSIFYDISLSTHLRIKWNCGFYFAVAAGSFFIQPLGSSCGFCCAAAAVVFKPIPHRHRLVDGWKLKRFFFFLPFSPFSLNPFKLPSNVVKEVELCTPRLSSLFPSPSGFVSANRSSKFEQGRTAAVGLPAL